MNQQNLGNTIQFRGRVKVIIEDTETGKSWVHHQKDNIIVNLGRQAICNLLTAPQTRLHIDTFKIGTSGHTGTDILSPATPLITDSNLKDTAAFSKRITSFDLLPATGTKNQIDFSIMLAKNEANPTGTSGKAYTEAGLYTNSGELFARETFPAIIKTPTRQISFVWSILL